MLVQDNPNASTPASSLDSALSVDGGSTRSSTNNNALDCISSTGSMGTSVTSNEQITETAPLVRYSQHLLRPNGSIMGRLVTQAVLPRFPDLLSAIPVTAVDEEPRSALRSIDGRNPMTHSQIRDFILKTGEVLHSPKLNIGRGHRIAVVLPNGPELALSLLAITTWASCVPLNAYGAAKELEADFVNSAADLVIGLNDNPEIQKLAQKVRLPFCGLVPDEEQAGVFTLVPPTTPHDITATPKRLSSNTNDDDSARLLPNQHEDEILVLFTSGTTGSKKLVPHLLADVLVATACIAVSWKLTPNDTNCNLMPLFHVGGIIRQVFSPILSGGCVICCPAFDPAIFWQLMMQDKPAFTWYYSAPTMHQLILQTGKAEGFIPTDSSWTTNRRLRMIANAAGGLLPSLARELRQAFGGANVLPSYGMTECMPITSPPATYQLEKPGTSGVAVGPELAILNPDTMEPLQNGKEGAICVKSEPCFRGYGVLFHDSHENVQQQSFLPGGWFNTGDLGYMDADGYLFITGRSKEVINRGGEIISPVEVEEAITGHSDVLACVAFSTQHSVLQEVVGLLLVPRPDRPRLDLPSLHDYLGQGRLAAPKWPQILIYCDSIPRSHTNKLLRVKLGKRLALPEINDSMNAIERTYQATCPPQGTPVSVAIPCERVKVNARFVQAVLRAALVTNPSQDVIVVPHPTKLGALVSHVCNLNRLAVVQVAQERLDACLVPHFVCVMNAPNLPLSDLAAPQWADAVGSILQEEKARGAGPTDSLVIELQELMQALLDLDCLPSPDTNFFNLGGSSMLASQLASRIRKLHLVPFGGAEVFHHPSCSAIANAISGRKRRDSGSDSSSQSTATKVDPASMAASSMFSKRLDLSRTPFEHNRLDSHSGFWSSVFQLLPLFVIYPTWQLTRFFLFFRCLLWILQVSPVEYNLYKFVLTLVVFHLGWVTVTPLLFVLLKWAVIGRYRQGRYAIWGRYYLRWWLVDVMRKLIGRGIWKSNYLFLNVYYRLLGAKIGKDARISLEADLAEYDLVTIGEGVTIEYSTVRGFGVDNGCMTLSPVSVGNHVSVGSRFVVAPFSEIPDNRHPGQVSISYEISPGHAATTTTDHLTCNRQALPEPLLVSQIFVVGPITFFVSALSHMPALAVLYWMLIMPWHRDEPFDTLGDVMEWLCDFRRIPFFIGIRIARAAVAPLVYMAGAILVKRLIVGKFKEGPRDTTSEWELVRHQLVSILFSRENMQDVTELLGRHYELVSVLYRLLGAKIGKRVFWPGNHPAFSGEFDLLEIGDDVVFGSRASIFCSTVDAYHKVLCCAGANVSDSTVLLPGSVIGKNAVLGSNTVCPVGRYLPEQSVWVGAKSGEPVLLERGVEDTSEPIMSSEVDPESLQMEGDDSTLRPFGKAFYLREATYFVWPLWMIIVFTLFTRVLFAALHTLPMLGALQLGAAYIYGWTIALRQYDDIQVLSSYLFVVLLSFFIFTHFVSVMIWFQIEVLSKWGLLGQREEGRYNYDSSSYCQRWELYQIINQVRFNGRTNTMDFLSGSPYLTMFFQALGLETGKDCCLYPSGGDPPYMTEPDLVEMGDRCVVDCAAMVCHLNTRGSYHLAKIKLENNVTLRAGSRIQPGVHMETNSMLLEKSLAMTGEVIEADSIWVGVPASRLLE